jgi:eukaryotic-like serine/threonine-protein kinase
MSAQAASDRAPEVQCLLDQILDDQRSRWGAGEGTPVEALLERAPALHQDQEAILDLIYQEYILRKAAGETPDPNDFAARFPNLAEPIMLQLGIDAAIEPSTERQTDLVGREAFRSLQAISGYEIIRELGRGGMGVVYQARDIELKRTVAIKTIADGRYAAAEQRERFRAEAQAVARLRHPNIIAIYAIAEHETQPYLSLEYAEGGSLAQKLAEKPTAPREAAELVGTLARAVHAAHQAGVVHRDLKPSNVLLAADGTPKVSDFGLAKLLDADSGHTVSGQIVGSPSYMAPEQAEGHSKRVGPQADIYALGAILYQSLTGRPPFLGESQMETLRLVCTAEPVPPRQLRPEISRDLETICLKCLEKEPHKRYASAEGLAGDLQFFLEDRPIAARPVGTAGRLARWTRRNPRAAVLSAAVLLSLLLAAGVSTTLAVRAIRAEVATRRERDLAETESENAKAVSDFLRSDLLAQASAHIQARPENKPDPDLKVRTLLDRTAAKISERFVGRPTIEASIRQTIGETYHRLGLYPQALVHLQRALDLRRQRLGDKHPDTLLAMGSLGAVYFSDGKLSDAEPLLANAVEGLRTVRGPNHPETLAAVNALAQLLCEQGKTSDAEKLLTSLRETYLLTRGADDPDTLDATNSLGAVYEADGKWELAERMFLAFLERAPTKLGADHPTALGVKSSLAGVYRAQGKLDEAAGLFTEAVNSQSKTLGRTHPDTLASMAQLGSLYADKGQLDKAEALLTEALEGCRAALDRNHVATEAALAGLADVYARKRDMPRLGKALLEAAEINRIRWGVDHATTASAYRAVGLFLLLQREYAKAELCFRDCLTYWVKNDPANRLRFVNELHYGIALLAQRKFSDAKHHLLIGYNGMRSDRKNSPQLEDVDLGRLIESIRQLRDDNGRTPDDTMVPLLHKDRAIQAIVLDLGFPANPFAP